MAYMLGQVEPYQQLKRYTCSAATLLAVIKHWGMLGFDEPTLSNLIEVSPEHGADIEAIRRTAMQLGFVAEVINFSSLAQVKKYLDADIPIIANVQSWRKPEDRHFVVLTAVDRMHVYLMDPNTPGNHRILTHAQMLEQWTGWRREGYVGLVILPKR
jgi:ABC-type bacteriocin/lantibiotic exporter with double-glycine peptidase domain